VKKACIFQRSNWSFILCLTLINPSRWTCSCSSSTKWKNAVYGDQNRRENVPLVKNQWNCCFTYRIGLELVKVAPYRAVTGCWGQDHKRAGRSRRSIFSFLFQAHQEACERSRVTTTKKQRTQVETPEDRLTTISVEQLQELCQKLKLEVL